MVKDNILIRCSVFNRIYFMNSFLHIHLFVWTVDTDRAAKCFGKKNSTIINIWSTISVKMLTNF